MLERRFVVVRKFTEETEKGLKYGIRLSNDEGDNLVLHFKSESDLDGFEIGDNLTVKVVNPQTTVDSFKGERNQT